MIVACKLPHGLQINHKGRILRLNGPNEGTDLSDPFKNGTERDTETSFAGFGLTELKGDDESTYKDWVQQVTYKDGDKAKGKHAEPFAALENGVLMDFTSMSAAKSELKALAGSINSGFEGLSEADAKKAGVEKNTDAK